MNKKEFLDILRQSLVGEVSDVVLEQNMRFYNEYISSHSDKSEEEIIDEIGDPRLIARTIIDTERIPAHGSFGSNNYNDYGHRQYYEDYDQHQNHGHRRSNGKKGYFRIKWYHKLALICLVILFVLTIFRAGLFLLKLLSVFIVPIIIISILWYMFRDI
ncbi:MAG: hypothetical protein GX321_02035 [Clostridiales bacterium]|nr:hypothetical protein [Clostridiales bacterium]